MNDIKDKQEILNAALKPIYKLYSDGSYKEALSALDKLIQEFPNNNFLYTMGGDCYSNLKQYKLAIACYDEALKSSLDNSVDTFCNKSNALIELQKYEEAIACAKKAIEIKNDHSPAFFNLGVSAMHLRFFDLSMESFNKAIELEPNFEKYKFAKSTLLLLYGDFKNGWALWESRWKLDKLFSAKLKTNLPVWTGNKNAKVLVWPEQGIGDQILYSSLLNDLSRKCSELIVIVDPRLINLLTRSMGDFCTFYPDNKKDVELDYDEHIPMGSLCQYFRTNEKDFECSQNGFLKDDAIKTANIKENISALAPAKNKICGISWRSSGIKKGTHKSINLKIFIETIKLEGYTFVSLQYGDTKKDIKEVKDELGLDVISYDKIDNFNDIDGLASLIQSCDVVLSVDNITCQLAGALGKEIHILLTLESWWGWMVNRDDSPWYNSAKLYRKELNETNLELLNKLKKSLDL
tara:strand:- start:2683 stop:4074 length:1392 start_codon:yes stop_codon:yes gene_type:complete